MPTTGEPSIMSNKSVANTQATLAQAALAQLAVIGGQMTNDDDIEFEGRKFIFPESFQGDLPGLQKFIIRYVEGQEEIIQVQKTFDFRPLDGGHAVYHCLKQFFGYAQSKARQGMFGPQPP